MSQYLIVTTTFTHPIDCFCPIEDHLDIITLKEGDVIEVTNDRKFTIGRGWYFLIIINNQCPFYIALDDLDQYYGQGKILSNVDIELKLNFIQFQINIALDTDHKENFLDYSTSFNKLKSLMDKYISFLKSNESTLSTN